MQYDKDKIIQLLISTEGDNNKIALQILKGNPQLKDIIQEHFQPLLKAANKKTLKAVPAIVKSLLNGKGKIETRLKIGSIPEIHGSIEKLYLNDTKLEQLPEWIKYLSNLKLLAVSGCGLKVLPEWIGNLTSLNFLTIANNEIDRIPNSFGNLKELQHCYLIQNKIKQLPDSITNLKKLHTIYLKKKNLFSKKEIAKIKTLLPQAKIF